jgi:hypothetical protein
VQGEWVAGPRLRTHHKAAAKFGDGPFFPCCTSWHFYLPGE